MEPEPSQAPSEARQSERAKLANMEASARSRIVTDLSRYILFKSLSGEPIDKTKLKEAFPDNLKDSRVTNAAVEEVNVRLQNIFGMSIQRCPEAISGNKLMPSKYKERYFVVNKISDDENGSHSKALHGVHIDSRVEKGLLMLILAFIYCKGEMREKTRWLDASVLYRLLNSVDENIPAEPADHRRQKKESIGGITNASSCVGGPGAATGVGLTPDVDIALEKFVHADYLVKKKADNGDGASDQSFQYAIGPRSLLVVGLKQIICFCAQVLDQEPDPTMLQEVEGYEDNEEVQTQQGAV